MRGWNSAPEQVADPRITRLDAIAVTLSDERTDPVPLVTEAAQLCGFVIRNEDRAKIADPTGSPALNLSVTDTEIKGFSQLFHSGHSVALSDFIAGMDVFYRGIGSKTSCGDIVRDWLQMGVFSKNASNQALVSFLQALGHQHSTLGDGAMGPSARLDPIQVLFIVRVLSEEMAGPLKKSLAKTKPPVYFASLDPDQGPAEVAGWAEDAFSGGMSGLWGAVSDLLNKVDSVGGTGSANSASAKYTDRLGKANAMLSIAKFILTYTYLKGEIRVADPGDPLVRTKDTSPGEKRTLVARFRIDGSKVTDWMKENRKLVSVAGLDIDMPRTGPLKGIETNWELGQSRKYASQQLVQVVGQVDISKVKADDNGDAKITLEGKPQAKALDPKRVKPQEKNMWIRVTPQVKSTEMQQDLTDAVLGAIGIKSGPGLGWLTPVMECLYRMKWTGSEHMTLHIRDWQKAETIGKLTIEIRARGIETTKDRQEIFTLDRTLEVSNMAMTVVGGEGAPKIDEAALQAMSPEMRKQMEDMMKKYEEMAKTRRFLATGPGTCAMRVNDQHTQFWDASDCMVRTGKSTTTWVGSKTFEFGARENVGQIFQFEVNADLVKKTAKVAISVPIEVTRFFSERVGDDSRSDMHKDSIDILESLHFLKEIKDPNGITVPLKETEIAGENKANYYGVATIPFSFGPNQKFTGTASISYSLSRELVKPK